MPTVPPPHEASVLTSRRRLQRQSSSELWRRASAQVQKLASTESLLALPEENDLLSVKEMQELAEERYPGSQGYGAASPVSTQNGAILVPIDESLGPAAGERSPNASILSDKAGGTGSRWRPRWLEGGYFGPPLTPGYALTSLSATVISFLMRQSFCLVFAVVIHNKKPFNQSVGVGIDIQTASAFVSILIGSLFSKIGCSISGPDIVAAIVFDSMAGIIASRVGDQPDVALATLLAAQLISTSLVGLTWLLLVRFRWTRVVSYMPLSVVMGFLGSVGYKVAKEAVKQATGKAWTFPETWKFWALLLPAVTFGVGLYGLKRAHFVRPSILLPLFLFVPVALFYAIGLGALGYSMGDLRDLGWMYPPLNHTQFHVEYQSLQPQLVDREALAYCIPEMLVLLLLTSIECLLWLNSMATALGVKLDMDYEVNLAGTQTLVSLAVLGVPGYSQVKSSTLNRDLIGNATDRRVGIATALLCGAMWFSNLPIVDYIPRFFLGGLLTYTAIPLFETNMIMSFAHLTKKEFVGVWVIALTNAIAGIWSNQSLVFSILAGVAIAFLIFALQSSNIDIIRAEMTGQDYQSLVLRSYDEMHLLDRIGHRFVIIELQHFIFFGSATQLLDLANALIRDQDPNNLANHVRYILLDFSHVLDVDYSAIRIFDETFRALHENNIEVFVSSLNSKVQTRFRKERLVGGKSGVVEVLEMDQAAEVVEEKMLRRAERIHRKWLVFDSLRKVHQGAVLKASYELFAAELGHETAHRLHKYLESVRVAQDEIIIEEGEQVNTLFMLHAGRATAFTSSDDSTVEYRRLHTITRGWFNTECLIEHVACAYSVVADQDCDLVVISEEHLVEMEAAEPDLMVIIQRKILQMEALMRQRLKREVSAVELAVQHRQHHATHLHQLTHHNQHGHSTPHHNHVLHPNVSAGKSMTVGNKVMATLRKEDHVAKSRMTQASLTFHSEVDAGWLLHDKHHEHFNFFHALFHHARTVDEHDTPPGERVRRISEGPTVDPSGREDGGEVPWEAARPHLSTHILHEAEETFLQHSDASAELTEIMAKKQRGGSPGAPDGDGSDEAISATLAGLLKTAEMPFKSLASATMDMGLFPTQLELQRYHHELSLRRQRAAGSPGSVADGKVDAEFVDFKEFVEIVKILLLDDLNATERENLHDLYMEFADADGRLHVAGFGRLMDSIGHPMERDEIDVVFREWQGQSVAGERDQWLTFDNFLSMMCVYLKREGVEEQVELDFLKFVGVYNGTGVEDINTICEALDTKNDSLVITAEGILAVYRHLNLPIDLAAAQDMVFDASSDGAGDFVTIEDFNRAILSVSRDELILDGERALRQSKLRHLRATTDGAASPAAEDRAENPESVATMAGHRTSLSRHGSPALLRRYASNVRQRHQSRGKRHPSTGGRTPDVVEIPYQESTV